MPRVALETTFEAVPAIKRILGEVDVSLRHAQYALFTIGCENANSIGMFMERFARTVASSKKRVLLISDAVVKPTKYMKTECTFSLTINEFEQLARCNDFDVVVVAHYGSIASAPGEVSNLGAHTKALLNYAKCRSCREQPTALVLGVSLFHSALDRFAFPYQALLQSASAFRVTDKELLVVKSRYGTII
jgi:hypothetical protein